MSLSESVPANAHEAPRNLSLFTAEASGRLALDAGSYEAFGHIAEIIVLIPGQLYQVDQGMDRARQFVVQTSPYLMCRCTHTATAMGVCKHLAAAMLIQDSPRITERAARWARRLKKLARPTTPEEAERVASTARLRLSVTERVSSTGADWPWALYYDPREGLSEWRQAARERPTVTLSRFMGLLPEALADPELSAFMINYVITDTMMVRWSQHSPPDRFAEVFARLRLAVAADVLTQKKWADQRTHLRPQDLARLLRSGEASVRAAAQESLVEMSGRRESGRQGDPRM